MEEAKLTTTNGTTGTINSIGYLPTQNSWYSYGSPERHFPFQIRKVKNGFVMNINGEDLVFNKLDDMIKLLAKELAK